MNPTKRIPLRAAQLREARRAAQDRGEALKNAAVIPPPIVIAEVEVAKEINPQTVSAPKRKTATTKNKSRNKSPARRSKEPVLRDEDSMEGDGSPGLEEVESLGLPMKRAHHEFPIVISDSTAETAKSASTHFPIGTVVVDVDGSGNSASPAKDCWM